MATLSSLISDVRSRLNEVIPRFWTDSDLTNYLNEALRDVARRTETIQDRKPYDVVASQESYDLPDDMLRIYRVEFRQVPGSISYPLEFAPFHNLDDIALSTREIVGGFPSWYSVWGTPGVGTRQLYIYPICSTSITDGMRVFYYRLPRKMVGTFDANGALTAGADPAEIPVGWENLVSLYVEVIARRKEAKDRRWEEAQGLYESALAHMIETTRQWTDQETFISPQGSAPIGMLPWVAGDWTW